MKHCCIRNQKSGNQKRFGPIKSEIFFPMTGYIIELMNRTESKDIVTCYMCSKGCWTPD